MKPKRFVRLFKPQFAEMVRDWLKRQTVRPIPTRMPQPGDVLDARMWSGLPYRSKQEKLVEAEIVEVRLIHIRHEGICVGGLADGEMLLASDPQAAVALWAFAKADGFRDWEEMREWFLKTHGLPFEGILIRW